jgi:hypothetical protein
MTEEEKGLLASTMSDASVALILGWSPAKVRKARTAPAPRPPAAIPPPVARAPRDPLKAAIGARPARWVRWFLAAGWPVGEVAWLFDLDPELVAAARPARSL